MIGSVFFYLFAISAVSAGVAILFASNIVRMAYLLIGMLLSVAGLYFLQGAYFLGVIQIIIYAGGVAVLMVFGVMLTSQRIAAHLRPRRWEALWLLLTAALLFLGVVAAVVNARWSGQTAQTSNDVFDFGIQLLGKFLGPFELASILLLIALLGAAYLARPKVPTLQAEDAADEP